MLYLIILSFCLFIVFIMICLRLNLPYFVLFCLVGLWRRKYGESM